MKREEVKDIVRQCVGKVPQEFGLTTWSQLVEKLTDKLMKVETDICQYTNDGMVATCEIWQASKSGCGECPLLRSRVRIIEERQNKIRNVG